MTSTTFFGTGHKAMLQWIGRLLFAIQERIDAAAEDDDDSMVDLVVAKKIAAVISNLMKEARKSGFESDEFRELATSQLAFLDMAPAVHANVLPSYIRTSARRYCIQMQPDPVEFWKLVQADRIGDGIMTLQEIQELQTAVVMNKIAGCQKSPADLKHNLRLFFGNRQTIEPSRVTKSLMIQCLALGMVADPEGTSAGDLDSALAMVADTANTVAHSLKLFPSGRQLVEHATTVQAQIRAGQERVRLLCEAVDRVEKLTPLAKQPFNPGAMRLALGDPLEQMGAALNALDKKDLSEDTGKIVNAAARGGREGPLEWRTGGREGGGPG